MKKYNYFPILKTTDAELKAFSNLDEEVKDNILPIFELTRSRRSKNNSNGNVDKRMERIEKLVGKRPFILDLTTERTLSNIQIDEMLEPKNKFQPWIQFIKQLKRKGLNLIPTIHYNPNILDAVKAEVKELEELSSYLAFRVGIKDDVISYVNKIAETFDMRKLILILDAGFVEAGGNDCVNKIERFKAIIKELKDTLTYQPFAIVCSSSSFPGSVSKNPYNIDNRFTIIENEITRQFLESKNIHHGDYGSVHPIRYTTKAWQWIPRIDFITDKEFIYFRNRREDGGYVKSAQEVLDASEYSKIEQFNVWGDGEIEAAAKDEPRGLSPSHWIAVRINLFITKQYIRLKEYPHMIL